jgi:cation diffusion facilitator CzcD-associated flavoprotein CzcO
VLVGKRVLVVGAGNSGCDIAVEATHYAAQTFHSLRRGYHFVPKIVFGKPTDQVAEVSHRLGVPLWLRRLTNSLMLQIVVGDLRQYGLPKPDHKLLEAHPLVNSQILYALRHGKIMPKCDVAELDGKHVVFKDGSREQIDVIIYATGFNISFPFIDKQHLNWQDTHPRLYLNVFHPEYDNLFVIGLIQPDSGQFWLADYQGKLVARFIHAQTHAPQKAARFHRVKAGKLPSVSGGVKYVGSERHYLEIEHYSYSEHFKRHIAEFAR